MRTKKSIKTVLGLILISLMVFGCSDSTDDDSTDDGPSDDGEEEPMAAKSWNKLVSKEELGPGGICDDGGVLLIAGRDLNNNGSLDRSEVDRREKVCQPDTGTDLAVRVNDSGATEECPGGGRTAEVVADENDDGEADDSEAVEGSFDFCHVTQDMADEGINQATAALDDMDGWLQEVEALEEPAGEFGEELENAGAFAETGSKAAMEATAYGLALAYNAFENGKIGDGSKDLNQINAQDFDSGSTSIDSGTIKKNNGFYVLDGSFEYSKDNSSHKTSVYIKVSFPDKEGQEFEGKIDELEVSNNQVVLKASNAVGDMTLVDSEESFYDGDNEDIEKASLKLESVTLESLGGDGNGNGMTFEGSLDFGPVHFMRPDESEDNEPVAFERFDFHGEFSNNDDESFRGSLNIRSSNADTFDPSIYDGKVIMDGYKYTYSTNESSYGIYDIQLSDDFDSLSYGAKEGVTIERVSENSIQVQRPEYTDTLDYSGHDDFPKVVKDIIKDDIQSWEADYKANEVEVEPVYQDLALGRSDGTFNARVVDVHDWGESTDNYRRLNMRLQLATTLDHEGTTHDVTATLAGKRLGKELAHLRFDLSHQGGDEDQSYFGLLTESFGDGSDPALAITDYSGLLVRMNTGDHSSNDSSAGSVYWHGAEVGTISEQSGEVVVDFENDTSYTFEVGSNK